MTDFSLDDAGDWIARLSCGHSQHVRHRPPFQERAWVLDEDSRGERLGAYLLCPLCDRAELPSGLRLTRTSPTWDNLTAPLALQKAHHLAEGTWGVITVKEGQMRFATRGEVSIETRVDADSPQVIPPELEHWVEFLGPVSFSIDFYKFEVNERNNLAEENICLPPAEAILDDADSQAGGESACFMNLVCTVCGAVLESDSHDH